MPENPLPRFKAGTNLAMKVPEPLYEKTVAFCRDVVALPPLEALPDGTVFAFGAMKLYIDRCPQMGQAEIWLQLTCEDTAAAAEHLAAAPGLRRLLDLRSRRHYPPDRRGALGHALRASRTAKGPPKRALGPKCEGIARLTPLASRGPS